MIETPDKLLADLDEAARTALSDVAIGHRLGLAIQQAAILIRQQNLVLEALTTLTKKAATPPGWVDDLLNRRTEVEHILRLPVQTMTRNQTHGRNDPLPPALTPEQMWALAEKLSVPAEFGKSDR